MSAGVEAQIDYKVIDVLLPEILECAENIGVEVHVETHNIDVAHFLAVRGFHDVVLINCGIHVSIFSNHNRRHAICDFRRAIVELHNVEVDCHVAVKD